jgi:protein gp37
MDQITDIVAVSVESQGSVWIGVVVSQQKAIQKPVHWHTLRQLVNVSMRAGIPYQDPQLTFV